MPRKEPDGSSDREVIGGDLAGWQVLVGARRGCWAGSADMTVTVGLCPWRRLRTELRGGAAHLLVEPERLLLTLALPPYRPPARQRTTQQWPPDTLTEASGAAADAHEQRGRAHTSLRACVVEDSDPDHGTLRVAGMLSLGVLAELVTMHLVVQKTPDGVVRLRGRCVESRQDLGVELPGRAASSKLVLSLDARLTPQAAT